VYRREGKEREGKGREGKGREGKGRKGKERKGKERRIDCVSIYYIQLGQPIINIYYS
jgi:hypothetical protein